MRNNKPLRVSVAGTGNVASHLIKSLATAPDIELVSISSRNPEHASDLRERLGIDVPVIPFDSIDRVKPDLVIVSVADNGVGDVVREIGTLTCKPLVVHTSGTLSRNELEKISPRTGVLYPLQSFTAGNEVDMRSVPFFIEAENEEDLDILELLTKKMGARSYRVDPEKRRLLHISGVFTNNFVNIILLETEKLLKTAGMELDVVEPLLRHTVDKALKLGPYKAMTGPARRGDKEVIEKQKSALPDDLKEVYSTLTDVILQEFNEQNKF